MDVLSPLAAKLWKRERLTVISFSGSDVLYGCALQA